MKILHITPSLDPKWGGPTEGIKNQGMQLEAMGHHIEILTLDDPDACFVKSHNLKVHALGNAKGSYRYCQALKPWLQKNAHEYDNIIINGIWQYHSFGSWRALTALNIPYYIYTHGMLDPWFKQTYPLKHLKKWLYWPWAEYRVLRDAKAVIFTCEEERQLARQSFWLYKVNEAVTSYGTATPPQNAEALRQKFYDEYPALAGKPFFLFLSRIHEKKGCDQLVKAFAKIAQSNSEIRLVIAGPDQTGLVKPLQKLAAELGIADKIYWPGMLSGDLKWGAFHACEAFILPSHQENFGIVVAEALACKKAVLISNKVNIWREIETDHAGLVENDDLQGTEKLMASWLSMTAVERANMQDQALSCFEQRFTVDAMAASLLRILK